MRISDNKNNSTSAQFRRKRKNDFRQIIQGNMYVKYIILYIYLECDKLIKIQF